ncbi:RimK family alpha-L-glutamate ligase [Actinomycetes bacterium KLBMP 9759]
MTASDPPRVGILGSRMRFEEKLIVAALGKRGIAYEWLDPRALFATAGTVAATPKLVLNRELGHYRALYAASALEASGATVLNTAEASTVCGDKWRTSVALVAAGIPTPSTTLAMTPDAALKALGEIGYPAVVKPLVGSWGRLVTLVRDEPMAAAVFEHIEALPSPQSHIVYLQALVRKADRDIRVVVVGGEPLGATHRTNHGWRTNVARGAVSEVCPLTDEIADLARRAAAAVGADIAGVDLIEDEEGRLTVLEVNDRVEFRGFQGAHTDIDVADRIAALLLARAES